jgi:hypothetical protein
MTALVRQEVDQTVSAVGGERTGFAGVKTDEAEGQDLADFRDALVRSHKILRQGVWSSHFSNLASSSLSNYLLRLGRNRPTGSRVDLDSSAGFR